MAIKKTTPEFDALAGMLSEVKNETDRSLALVVSAWLDDALEHYIKSTMVDDAETLKNLFATDRALGTFSAKINLAYALGLIPKVTASDLHSIRDMRNRFAHERGPITFADQSMKDRCRALAIIESVNAASADAITETRSQFLFGSLLHAAYFLTASSAA